MSIGPGSRGLVSVIIPVYGTEAYLSQTLDSVLAQTYTRYEITVVNDGSPGIALLERVIGPYRNRVNYIVQENRGVSGARNTGIKAAHGEYVAILDSDDYWVPAYLSSQIAILEEDPGIDLVYPDVVVFWPDGGEQAILGRASRRRRDHLSARAERELSDFRRRYRSPRLVHFGLACMTKIS